MSKKEKFKAIRSPIVYQGSKGRYAETISKLLPPKSEVKTALDLFTGSGEVGVGMMDYDHVVCNDFTTQIVRIHNWFLSWAKSGNESGSLVRFIQSQEKAFFLEKFHKDNLKDLTTAYLGLRKEYNQCKDDSLLLYLLHCNSFSNGLRFDGKGKMTQPYGRRNFNPSLQKKMVAWIDLLKTKNVEFMSKDFRKVEFNEFDFVYLDPPYYLTDSSYQESKKTAWGLREEYALYTKLDNYKGKFMLSNQIFSKGKSNYILEEWLARRKDLKVITMDSENYRNCNYQREDGLTVEVLVTNY